jgi:hypothetical protein
VLCIREVRWLQLWTVILVEDGLINIKNSKFSKVYAEESRGRARELRKKTKVVGKETVKSWRDGVDEVIELTVGTKTTSNRKFFTKICNLDHKWSIQRQFC